jgi:hypothetical protein
MTQRGGVCGELELFGLEAEGAALGLVFALGLVGEVGDVEEDVFDCPVAGVFGAGVVGEDVLLLFGLDLVPGAIDMREFFGAEDGFGLVGGLELEDC